MEIDSSTPSYYIAGGGEEQTFQNSYVGVSENPAAATAAAGTTRMGFDEAFLNGYFSEISFKSLLKPMPASALATLSRNHDTSIYSGDFSSSDVHFQDLASSSYRYMQQFSPASTETPPPRWNHGAVTLHHQDFKIPQRERFDSQEFSFQLLKNCNGVDKTSEDVTTEPLINFFAPAKHVPGAAAFGGRSDLKTAGIGSVNTSDLSFAFHADSPTYYQAGYLSDIFSTTTHRQLTLDQSSSSSNYFGQTRYVPYSKSPEASRHRRKRISEKIRRLRELLPSYKKMDMGTVLEEVYKYVKFLEAQVQILQAMPPHQCTDIRPALLPPPPPPSNPNLNVINSLSHHTNFKNLVDGDVSVWGDLLAKMNRQQ